MPRTALPWRSWATTCSWRRPRTTSQRRAQSIDDHSARGNRSCPLLAGCQDGSTALPTRVASQLAVPRPRSRIAPAISTSRRTRATLGDVAPTGFRCRAVSSLLERTSPLEGILECSSGQVYCAMTVLPGSTRIGWPNRLLNFAYTYQQEPVGLFSPKRVLPRTQPRGNVQRWTAAHRLRWFVFSDWRS